MSSTFFSVVFVMMDCTKYSVGASAHCMSSKKSITEYRMVKTCRDVSILLLPRSRSHLCHRRIKDFYLKKGGQYTFESESVFCSWQHWNGRLGANDGLNLWNDVNEDLAKWMCGGNYGAPPQFELFSMLVLVTCRKATTQPELTLYMKECAVPLS